MANYVLRLALTLSMIILSVFVLTYPVCHDMHHIYSPSDTLFDKIFKMIYICLVGGLVGYFAAKYLGNSKDIFHTRSV